MSLKVWPRARLYNTLKSMLGSEFPPLVPKTDVFCLKKFFFFVVRTQNQIYPFNKILSVQYNIVDSGLTVFYLISLESIHFD